MRDIRISPRRWNYALIEIICSMFHDIAYVILLHLHHENHALVCILKSCCVIFCDPPFLLISTSLMQHAHTSDHSSSSPKFLFHSNFSFLLYYIYFHVTFSLSRKCSFFSCKPYTLPLTPLSIFSSFEDVLVGFQNGSSLNLIRTCIIFLPLKVARSIYSKSTYFQE